MYAFKIIGALFIALGGGAVYYLLYRREHTALRRAASWESLATFIASQVECFALPIGQILSAAERGVLEGCGYTGEGTPADLREMIGGSVIEDRVTREAAVRFCGEFGREYASGQAARCRYYAAAFEERKGRISAELPSKKRLYSTLCIAAGLAALIIFW